jgi:similar to stage IV sporulation protein
VRLDDLWAYLGGFVRIRVSGPAAERFVNLVAARGESLWRMRRTARTIEADVSLRTFRRLRPVARRTRSGVRIIGRRGLPFLLRGAGRRPLLVAGAVVSAAALFLLSSVVWVVRIEGAEQFDPGLLREVVGSLGVRPGVLKSAVDPRQVERALILSVNGISWAAVEMQGVVVSVRIVEKDPLERPDVMVPPAHVLAAKDGVIQTLIVLAGQSVVKEGDTVRKGQLLVWGSQPTETPAVARAIVKARVWYQAYAEVRLHTLTHEPTGRLWRTVTVRLSRGGSAVSPTGEADATALSVCVFGWWNRPSGLYERQTKTVRLPLGKTGGPSAEIVTALRREVRDVRRDLSPEEAGLLARDIAAEALGRLVPQGSPPLGYHFEVVLRNDILIGVLASAEVIEDIAQGQQAP